MPEGDADLNASTPAGESSETEVTTQPLLGTLQQANNCSLDEQIFINRTLDAARFVAVSEAYRECLTGTMRDGRWLQRYGSSQIHGPYTPYRSSPLPDFLPDDPFTGPSTEFMANQAFYAAGSRSNLNITCDRTTDSSDDPWGKVDDFGSWSEARQHPESFRLIAIQDRVGRDNGLSSSHADFYQAPRAEAANTMWHEAMHQWGYRHTSGVDLRYLPYIVGACMETVMKQSANCTQSCGAGQRPVGAGCKCIDDPKFDVGVFVPSAVGMACPELPGRGRQELTKTTIYMDDEDSGNANARSGSHPGVTSTSNTKFEICRVPGTGFRRRAGTPSKSLNYAVLRMGPGCPPGSVGFSRYFDNEDSSNANSTVYYVPPHSVSSNTNLEFCMFVGGSTGGSTSPFPNLGFSYSLFAPSSFPGLLATGMVQTDDEDSSNTNGFGGSFSEAANFISAGPGSSTVMRFGKAR